MVCMVLIDLCNAINANCLVCIKAKWQKMRVAIVSISILEIQISENQITDTNVILSFVVPWSLRDYEIKVSPKEKSSRRCRDCVWLLRWMEVSEAHFRGLDNGTGKNRTEVNASFCLAAHWGALSRSKPDAHIFWTCTWSPEESLGMQLVNKERQHDFCIVSSAEKWMDSRRYFYLACKFVNFTE